MWVKICANTSLKDAQMAADLGADAVGFVFAPSARQVTPEDAGRMTARLGGGAERIGVFPDWEFEAVRRAVRVAGLTGVQMHGAYRPELLQRLRLEFGDAVTLAQTLHWTVPVAVKKVVANGDPTLADDGAVDKDGAPDLSGLAESLLGRMREITQDGIVDRVLVDSKVGAALGGTGKAFDWKAARGLFEDPALPMIVAGGLTPENVGEAIGRLRPWGVDMASGVELEPGRKDFARLRVFMERARA